MNFISEFVEVFGDAAGFVLNGVTNFLCVIGNLF